MGNVIFNLQNEAADLRKRVSACRTLEDQINNFQSLLNAEANNRRAAEEEGRARLDSSATFLAALRAEVEAQRRQLGDRRKQNGELAEELRRTQDQGDNKRSDNGRLRLELDRSKDLNEQLGGRKRQLIDDSLALRDRNARDTGDIDSMNIQNDQKTRECGDLQQRIKILEYDLAKSIQRSDDCSRLLEQRSQDLKAKELALKELEGEVVRLKTVQAAQEREVEHQRSVDQRLRSENAELERRLEGESRRNND